MGHLVVRIPVNASFVFERRDKTKTMRIDSAKIGMESEHTYTTTESKVTAYSVRANANAAYTDVSTTTGSFSSMLNVVPKGSVANEESLQEQVKRLREEFLNFLIRLFFPDKKLDLMENKGASLLGHGPEPDSANIISIGRKTEYYFEETESMSFKAEGRVITSDGRQIDFGLNLNMSREFMEYYSEEVNFLERSLTDPLVINFDCSATELSDMTFNFDIDADGVEDEISQLVAGCGFLALDKNEDGIINDGSELFGAATGNGYKELSAYDTDGDGFIDEDDEVFDKLRIMTVDEDGTKHLYSLKEKDVGAIYLGYNAAPFSLNSLETNETNGIIRSTGIFLHENGDVGTVQQIDMAKRTQALRAYA